MSKKYSFLIQAKHVFDGKQKSTYEGFLCLKDKQIVKMGKGKASQKIQEEAEEILEFDKELVMPGVTDTHTFFTGYAVFHLGVDVSEIKTNEEGEKALKAYEEEKHPKNVLFGHGWKPTQWKQKDGEQMLEEVFPDKPVILFAEDRGSCIMNEKAKEVYQFTSDSCYPESYYRIMKEYLNDREFIEKELKDYAAMLNSREIVSHADANIYVECGYEDAGSTTKGYTATVLTLYLFLLEVAKNSEGDLKLKEEEMTVYEERIQKVILNLPKLLPICEKWAEKEAKKLRTCTDLIILTESNQKSLLLEEVLKISETSRFPVRGYEACEFIHGMYNAVTEQTEFLYLFSQSGSDSKEMQHLYEYYKGKNKQYAVNTQKENDDGLYAEFLQDSDFSTLEYTIPFQMFFVKASRERGIDLNIPKDPQFHHYMGSKIGQ